MRDGWKRVKLGEVAEVLLGKMLDQRKNRGEYYPFLNNVSVRWGAFDLSNIGEMRFEREEIERYQIRKGDIVVCEGGESGRCAMWKNEEPILYQKALHRVRVVSGADQLFLYYQLFDTFRNGKADSLITGSTIKHLPRQAMLQVPISLPPLATQRRIAAVLGALDDKIELNRKMNANLEAQAQALFKSWFVDFEPWGGKMPSGWRMGTIADIADVVGGGTPSKAKNEYFAENGIAWLTPKDLSITHAKFTARGTSDITEEGLRNSGARLMPKGSVLFSSRAPIGYLTIAQNEICTNQGFKSLVPRILGTAYLYYYLQNATPRIQSMASGSTFKEASGSLMKSLEILIPKETTSSDFEARMKPIFQEQELIERESRKLAELRDALLPKLMSGELEVA